MSTLTHIHWITREFAVVFAVIIIRVVVILLVGNNWWLTGLTTAALLIGFHFRDRLPSWVRAALTGLMIAVILNASFSLVRLMRDNIKNPPVFDFQLYWVYGQASALGLNPYEQENLLQLAQPLNPAEILTNELYFFQTPPSIFIYAPLGWFNINTAYLVWYIINGVVLIGCIYLLWAIFMKEARLFGLGLITALTLSYPPVIWTILVGQVNFIILLLLLLFWQHRHQRQGGIWIALAILIKPIIVFLPLYWVLRKQWQPFIGFIATLLVTSTLTILVYGPVMFLSYITQNPIINDLPASLYIEYVNQSLLATVLRLTNYDVAVASPYLQPLFIVLALAVVGLSSWIVYHSDESKNDLNINIILLLALLIFPKTLIHYTVYLLIPFFWLWQQRELFKYFVWITTGILTIEFMLAAQNPEWIFWLIIIFWLIMIGIGSWSLRQTSRNPLLVSTKG